MCTFLCYIAASYEVLASSSTTVFDSSYIFRNFARGAWVIHNWRHHKGEGAVQILVWSDFQDVSGMMRGGVKKFEIVVSSFMDEPKRKCQKMKKKVLTWWNEVPKMSKHASRLYHQVTICCNLSCLFTNIWPSSGLPILRRDKNWTQGNK